MHVSEVLQVGLRFRIQIISVNDGDARMTRLGHNGTRRPLQGPGQVTANQHVLYYITHCVNGVSSPKIKIKLLYQLNVVNAHAGTY